MEVFAEDECLFALCDAFADGGWGDCKVDVRVGHWFAPVQGTALQPYDRHRVSIAGACYDVNAYGRIGGDRIYSIFCCLAEGAWFADAAEGMQYVLFFPRRASTIRFRWVR